MTTDDTGDDAPPVPVLGYATPAADGLPEWHADAEILIDEGKPAESLRGMFRRTEDAVAYYAKSLARRHGLANVGSTCEVCGQPDTRTAVVAKWSAWCAYRTTEFRTTKKLATADFTTLHAMCVPCCAKWSQKQLRFMLLHWAFLGLNGAALLVFVVGPIVFRRLGSGQLGSPRIYQFEGAVIGFLVLITFSRWAAGRRFRGTTLKNILRKLPNTVSFLGIGELVRVVEADGKRSTVSMTE